MHRLSSAFLCHQQALKDFSEAGTEERKRMLPKVTKKLVYIRYEKKYRKWMERLGVSVSKEELKKGIEDDGADGYEVGVLDEDLARKVTVTVV